MMEVDLFLTFDLSRFETEDPHEAVDILKSQIEDYYEDCGLTIYIREYGVNEEYDDYTNED